MNPYVFYQIAQADGQTKQAIRNPLRGVRRMAQAGVALSGAALGAQILGQVLEHRMAREAMRRQTRDFLGLGAGVAAGIGSGIAANRPAQSDDMHHQGGWQ